MKPWDLVGYRLLNDSTITAIVGDRIWLMVRPASSAQKPCITFHPVDFSGDAFQVSGGTVQNPTYQISCRAETPQGSAELGRLVGISFNRGSGTLNGFDVLICNQQPTGGGVIPEDDGECYLTPVLIQFVYQDNTIT